MASVTFESVFKRYGDVTAVDDLNLEIEDGEFMVLLGPSGCGKTTALRMIAGLEDISEGGLYIGQDLVNDVDPARRDISMVFQSYALYPHMTVRKNIESPLLTRRYQMEEGAAPRKLNAAERNERVEEAARVLGLEPYMKRKPGALSGGQRQRVALARAFVGRPRAYLMDEPLSNLDAKLRAQTRIELVDLHRRVGTTIVYVTHDQVEAMTMATRVAVMSMGKLQQVGTPAEVYDRPRNTFVAQFIGTPPMNCVNTTIGADGNPVLGDGAVARPIGLTSTLVAGQPVVVGVRPENIHLDQAGSFGATVRAEEWLGHESLITLELADGATLTSRIVGRTGIGVGEPVRLRIDAADLHLFDADTTERLP
jgi:ABC-type sugar transport system ATPase subunit